MSIVSLTSLGTSLSPNYSGIIFGIEQINQYGTNHNDLANLFVNTKSINGTWTFSTLPILGTLTGVIKGATGVLTGGATLTDLGSPTSAFNFGNQDLKNVSSLLIGSNTASGYNSAIRNAQPIVNFLGTDKGHISLENGYTYAGNQNKYLSIDFTYELNYDKPNARIACQLTDTGTFLTFGSSTVFSSGLTNIDMISGYFATETTNGIKVKDSVLFTTNNVGSIGTSSIAVANIYSVNALNVTSDNDEKKDINKNIPLGLDFVKLVANNAIANYSWKDTIIPEKKVNNFKRVEKINNETKEKTIDYELETIILEPEKIEKHSRTRWGFLGEELYNAIIASGLDTKKCAFLSVYDEDQIYRDEKNVLTGEIKENKKKKPFEVKLTKEGRPKGKITIQPTEMLPILFKAILEQSQQIEELQAQVKLLLEK